MSEKNRLKSLIQEMVKQSATEKMVGEYYQKFFSRFSSNELFEIYDVVKEKFVSFPGREGSQVVNKDTLVRNLSEMEANHGRIDELLILQYDADDVCFSEPVFIGSVDSFYAQGG